MNKFIEQYFRLVKKFLPDVQKPSTIGLDVGSTSCKAVELTPGPNGFALKNWCIEPIQEGDLKACLEKIVAKMDFNSKVLINSVSGKGTLIRYIDMPRMGLEELKKSFAIEADKYFPFDPGSIYTDCCILDPAGKDKRMSVLVCAVKKEIVDQRMRLLSAVGLESTVITINAIAVANAFEALSRNHPPAEGKENLARAILDIGDSVSNLMIIKDNVPRFTRDIFIGSHELSKKIANVMGIALKDAERLKCDPQDKLEDVFGVCESTIMNLISEIRLSLDYFITEKNIQVDQLYLTGGGALFNGMSTLFEKALDIPVTIWDPLKDITYSAEVPKEQLEYYSSRLSVAIGLGLN